MQMSNLDYRYCGTEVGGVMALGASTTNDLTTLLILYVTTSDGRDEGPRRCAGKNRWERAEVVISFTTAQHGRVLPFRHSVPGRKGTSRVRDTGGHALAARRVDCPGDAVSILGKRKGRSDPHHFISRTAQITQVL